MNNIQFATPPPKARQALIKGGELHKKTDSENITAKKENKLATNVTDPAPVQTHPVYTATLEDIKAGKGLQALTITGWRSIAQDDSGESYSIEANYDRSKDDYVLSEINHGPFPKATLNFLAHADKHESLKKDNFELRIVRIPALYIFALWLHGKKEYFAVLPPAASGIDTDKLYNQDDFFAALKNLADKRPSFDDTPRG